jgi:indolepyruvate ferredoxin oxidoreductase
LRKPTGTRDIAQTLEERIARRVAFLTDYQNAAYAARYRAAVETVAVAEQAKMPGSEALTDAVARYLFKLMAVKDEYEVGRLYTNGAFAKQLAAAFEGDVKLEFHLAPPLLGRRDGKGEPVKTSFGPWMLRGFKALAALRGLRGTLFDVFGYTKERRMERQLIADYEALLAEIVEKLTPANHALGVALASIPEKIRGFGHVKLRHLEAAKAEEQALREQFRAGPAPVAVAAE